jgi:hypothetical protein
MWLLVLVRVVASLFSSFCLAWLRVAEWVCSLCGFGSVIIDFRPTFFKKLSILFLINGWIKQSFCLRFKKKDVRQARRWFGKEKVFWNSYN